MMGRDKGQVVAIGVTVLVVLVMLGFMMTFGWTNIQPTEVGVEVDKVAGKVKLIPLGVGYHTYNRWVTDITTYEINSRAYPPQTGKSEKEKAYTLELKTNDGQNIEVDLTIIYALKANEVPLLHAQLGRNYEDQILLPQIRSEARISIGSYSAEELYTGKVRDNIQKDIIARLKGSIEKYPAIIIQDALIRHFAFSTAFEGAIEQKKIAAQQIEINKNLALAQEEVAKKQEAEARGEKLKAIQSAEGRAQAVRVEADASRYALEQNALGQLARLKSEAEGKRLLCEALAGEGGKNVVALKWAENIPDKLQIWGIPTGNSSASFMDISGVFGKMLQPKGEQKQEK